MEHAKNVSPLVQRRLNQYDITDACVTISCGSMPDYHDRSSDNAGTGCRKRLLTRTFPMTELVHIRSFPRLRIR